MPDPNLPMVKKARPKKGGRAPLIKRRKSRMLYTPMPNEADEVERLCGLGFSIEEVGLITGIPRGKLETDPEFRKRLTVGLLKADAAVLGNLAQIASSDGPNSTTAAIFWAKVRRRWHEVQRVIHGYDPETIQTFVKSVVSMLRRELPANCPHCKTALGLPEKVGAQLRDLSAKMAERLPQSEIGPMPRPELASDAIVETPLDRKADAEDRERAK